MASTGSVNGSHSYVTFRGIANTSSVGTNSVDSNELAKSNGYVNLAIDIDDRLIAYGTINSVSISYGAYGSRTNTLYKRCTAKTGYIATGSDNSGSLNWKATHDEWAGRGSDDIQSTTDTFTPARSNDGKYHLLMGGVNNNTSFKQYFYFRNISLNITYTPRQHTVKFVNHDGTVLQSTTMDYGSTPSYSGTPTKDSTAQYHYTFSGWDKTISTVTADVTYTAQFTATERSYEIKVICSPEGTGTLTGGGTYTYGSSVALTANAGDIYKFVCWNDGVTNSTKTVTVTGAATYTAYFKLNAVFVDAAQSFEVLVDTVEANEIYADEIKVYG